MLRHIVMWNYSKRLFNPITLSVKTLNALWRLASLCVMGFKVRLLYANELTDRQKQEAGEKVKAELEALKGLISEIVEMKVYANPLPTSNMDVVLDSSFENENAMAAYKIHPEHKRVSQYISSVLRNRMVMDYCE